MPGGNNVAQRTFPNCSASHRALPLSGRHLTRTDAGLLEDLTAFFDSPGRRVKRRRRRNVKDNARNEQHGVGPAPRRPPPGLPRHPPRLFAPKPPAHEQPLPGCMHSLPSQESISGLTTLPGYASNTFSPANQVCFTVMNRIPSTSTEVGSAERITKSADLPTSNEPASSARPMASALLDV
jgi:hypothetical protein